MVFNIIDIVNYNIILGISWLKKYNPQINWKRETLTMEYECILDSKSYYQLNIVKDKRISWKT